MLVRSQRFRFSSFRLAMLQESILGLYVLMHRAGGGASSSASSLVGAFPSGFAPRSCFGRYGVTASQTWAGSPSRGISAGAWRLILNSPGDRLPSRQGSTRVFGGNLFGDLGSALESVDESESVLSWARLARPLHHSCYLPARSRCYLG